MNFRHAAAVSLLGWYLITPPAKLSITANVGDSAAPLSKWQIVQGFGTANDCEKRKLQLEQGLANARLPNPQIEALKRKISEAQCVAADDPRLKKKPERFRLKRTSP